MIHSSVTSYVRSARLRKPVITTDCFCGIALSLRVVLLALGLSWVELCAEKVGWHPDLVLELGRGTDPRNHEVIRPILAEMASTPNASPNTGDMRINVRFVQHEFDLAKSFSLNASLSAKNKLVQGKLKFSMADSYNNSGNAITFVFECERNFGDKLHATLAMSPNFVATVNELKRSLQGAALHKAIADRFGTHFVAGQQRAAKVVVIYTLTYESQATSRARTLDFALKYNAGVTQARFETDLKEEMNRKDSRVSLSYQFWSSDPLQPPDFSLSGKISSFDEFLAYSTKLEAYCKNMNPANARDFAYILEPIQNLPGYLQLLGGFKPETFFESGYDRFMTTYSQLAAWDQLLNQWSLDPKRMSWLNAAGEEVVRALKEDVGRLIRNLETLAKDHFQNGTSLDANVDLTAIRQNLSRVPLPTINLSLATQHPDHPWHSLRIGFVNCGLREYTRDYPFAAYHLLDSALREIHPFVSTITLDWDIGNFEQTLRGVGYPSAKNFADSSSMSALKETFKRYRLGLFIFWTGSFEAQAAINGGYLGIKDSAGELVSVLHSLELRSDLGAPVSRASSQVDLSLSRVVPEKAAQVGVPSDFKFSVSNHGPGAAYGVVVNLPIPTGFRFRAVSGSQGIGSFSNGKVEYLVGSLGFGSTVEIHLNLIPSKDGALTPTQLAAVAVGPRLTDSQSANDMVAFPAMDVAPARLDWRVTENLLELRWDSGGEGLQLEQADGLEPALLWVPVVGNITKTGDSNSLQIPSSNSKRFYRLRGQ